MGGSRPAGLSGHGLACQAKLNVRPGRLDWSSATLVAVGAALLLLLLVAVGAALMLLVVVGAALLLLLLAVGAALHLAAVGAESQQYDTMPN